MTAWHRRFSHLLLFLSLCSMVSAGSGCSIADLQTADRMDRGLVVILPGIEGRSRWNLDLARGLDEGGVDLGIEIYDWGTAVPLGLLINLTDKARNRRVAAGLSRRILTYQAEHPGCSVHLVGHSAGAGVALMAVEALPAEARVTTVVLLAAAVSPNLDLRRTLRRTEHGVYNYYSNRDIAYLKLGTSMFGTMDRRYGPSAGAVGFRRPRSFKRADDALYDKLHSIRWRPAMRRYGHHGGHTDWTGRPFVRHYLAPLIRSLSAGPCGVEPAKPASPGTPASWVRDGSATLTADWVGPIRTATVSERTHCGRPTPSKLRCRLPCGAGFQPAPAACHWPLLQPCPSALPRLIGWGALASRRCSSSENAWAIRPTRPVSPSVTPQGCVIRRHADSATPPGLMAPFRRRRSYRSDCLDDAFGDRDRGLHRKRGDIADMA